MTDWTSSMQQSYEFYKVNPATWQDEQVLDNILSCSITRDLSAETLGSATIDCTEVMEECYVRVYLKVIQNGLTERFPLGTFLVQTPSVSFDGKSKTISLDAYTPLIELKGVLPPIGYSILKKSTIMSTASRLCRENLRAPVIASDSDKTLEYDFVANLSDTWMVFLMDLIKNADYQFGLDELGRVIFEPVQEMRALQPVWTYDDGNSSILYADIQDERDLYGIPNVVEVVYSTTSSYFYSRVVNDSESSPISTVNRGREVIYRDTNPSFSGEPSQTVIDEYAKRLLRDLSSLQHKITYKHGYCPVRLGDCVILDYAKAGLENIKAKVISQNISCVTGCVVEETAVYVEDLWDGGE